MRCALIAILVAIPVALVTWVISRGVYAPAPGERDAGLSGKATTAAAASPASQAAPDPDAVLLGLFAGTLGKATVQGKAELYDAQGLYDYINGAAPVFIEHGFRKLAAAEMATDDGGELTCDVYDMQSPANATAIYTKEQPSRAEPIDMGDAGRLSAMAIVFREGPYYVKLTAFDGPGEAALPAVAAALSEAIP